MGDLFVLLTGRKPGKTRIILIVSKRRGFMNVKDYRLLPTEEKNLLIIMLNPWGENSWRGGGEGGGVPQLILTNLNNNHEGTINFKTLGSSRPGGHRPS